MIDFKEINRYFFSESIYCFTADIDWATELAISRMLDVFDEYQIPLTPFITHSSEVINVAYRHLKEHVGLHPNFLSKSTHLENGKNAIDFCKALWPCSKFYRAHSFFDSYSNALLFKEKGFEYDSNSIEFLRPYCSPYKHGSGLIRFPVFWEDDIFRRNGFEFKTNSILGELQTPGLKIFNFHPTLFINDEIIFFKELVDFINSCNGKIMFLNDVYGFLENFNNE